MSEELIKGLDQTLFGIEESVSTQKAILTEVRKTSDIYTKILLELKKQNAILTELRKAGKLVTVM